jgi:hypothetical protein
VAKLAAANGGAKLIAGGHSLVPLMKLRLAEPKGADRYQPYRGAFRDPRGQRTD